MDLFEPTPELSSDLDWMLQSGQASLETLLEALLLEYYRPVYCLALATLGEPRLARQAAVNIFSTALLSVYRYRSAAGVQVWLFGLALEALSRPRPDLVFQPISSRFSRFAGAAMPAPQSEIDARLWSVVDRLDKQERSLVLFHYLLGWTEAEIARLLPANEQELHARFKQFRPKFLQALMLYGLTSRGSEAEHLDERLAGSLRHRWPAPELSSQDFDRLAIQILDQAERRGARQRRSTSFNEILLVGVAVLFAAGFFWGYNRFFPEPEPTAIVQVQPTATRTATRLPAHTPTRTRWPSSTPVISPTLTPFPENVFYFIQPGDTLESVAGRLDVSPQALLELNRLPEGATLLPGQALLIPGRLAVSTAFVPTPVTPAPQQTPLTTASDPHEIIERIGGLGGAANTVWFDARIVYYGPQAYRGPPQEYRLQGWFGQGPYLLLGGLTPNPYDALMSPSTEGDPFFYASPGKHQQPWFIQPSMEDENAFMETVYPIFGLLTEIFRPPLLFVPGQQPYLSFVGSQEVAGREALVVDFLDQNGSPTTRLWLDELTGLILHKQNFEPGSDGRLLSETLITGLALDIDFPQELFDPRLPWRGGYAFDHTGSPVPVDFQPTPWAQATARPPLPTRTPPSGFDPAGSKLAFQADHSFNIFDRPASTRGAIDLYAGEYFLARVEFPDPINTICDRSPDGMKIAFSPQSLYSDFSYYSSQPARLQWINLARPGEVLNPLGQVKAFEFVFAPDNRRLAFFGELDGQRGVYILDTGSGASRRLSSPLTTSLIARSLAWSPDGEYLAFLLMDPPYESSSEQAVVIRVSTAEVVYLGRIIDPDLPLPGATPAPGWLAEIWSNGFPRDMGNLTSCSLPPSP